ncbi:MAG TPA: hypothetical protein VGR89_13495 [Puia sp.]|nr:hypothetical protein [Puia sp.]
MKPKPSWLVLLLIVLINSCQESQKRNFDIPRDSVGKNTTVSCDSLLTLLVQTSSLDKSEKQGFQVQTDDVVKGVLKIKITNRNELGVDVPIALLDLDIKKRSLTDVTPNHDKPVELRYDTTVFNTIVKNCKVVE